MDTGRNCNGKRKKSYVVLAAALSSVVAVLGGAGRSSAQPPAARKEEVRKRVDTEEIRKALQAKLSGDARFSRVSNVKVDPANGVVTLTGRVATEADRDAVGKLVSSVKGVAMIYNEIQPEKPGP